MNHVVFLYIEIDPKIIIIIMIKLTLVDLVDW